MASKEKSPCSQKLSGGGQAIRAWGPEMLLLENLELKTIFATLIIVHCTLEFVPLASVTWESKGYTL